MGETFMFENKENNRKMIVGAYKKLKSYYYYNKSILFNKMRLAMWEDEERQMSERIDNLANFLTTIESDCDQVFLQMLMKNVSLVPVPKSFEIQNNEKNLLKNSISKECNLISVNFYIKAPVELLILDTIWMLMVSKIAYEQNVITSEMYANQLKRQMFNNNRDLFEGVDFASNRAFIPYFNQYTTWRDNAFKKVRDKYKKEKDSILITLDIKSYYYSVIFDFNDLCRYLNSDERLDTLKPLTNIIQSVYINYTAEMQRYRGSIPADCKKQQSAFPIGLLSSMLLSNLYLKDFDDAVMNRLTPDYYGRYVDDIIIVIDKTDEMELSVESILQNALENTGIIGPMDNNEYPTIIPKDLKLQKNKIRCIYFDHLESDAMIKLLCEINNLKPSIEAGNLMPDLMPDIDLSEKSFDESAYSIGERNGAIKVRDFLFSSNNYTATLFLNDLIRASKNVDISDTKYQTYIDNQLKQILRFYSSSQAIEYRSSWINVFILILINEKFDYFRDFYIQTFESIDRISPAVSGIDNIQSAKRDTIITRVKDALKEQLNLAAAIAIAPLSHQKVEQQISNAFIDKKQLFKLLANIFQDAKDIRNANMFNNHVLSFPLVSYILDTDDGKLSFIDASPKDIAEMVTDASKLVPLNDRKLYLSPRFIHLEEIYMISFLVNFASGGNPFAGKVDHLIKKFFEINQIHTDIGSIEENLHEVPDQLNLHHITIPKNKYYRKKNKNGSIKIALASINLDEARDVMPTITSPKHNLSPAEKSKFYKLLNNAIENEADMIVFPEYFLPIEWLEEVYAFSRKNQISVVSGLRYIIQVNRAYNFLMVLQPFASWGGFRYSLPLLREKNHYAPAEVHALTDNNLICIDPINPSTHLITLENFSYSDLLCYELTNISLRHALRSKIELLIVPELNPDTEYFSNIVESTSRDLHCFVVQANTSKYGDSRITGPYNSMFKDIIKIKGGENNVLLIGTVELAELIENRNSNLNQNPSSSPTKLNRRMKKPPAGFDSRKEEMR